MEKTNCLLDAVKNQLQNAISNIDAGNSNLNEEEMEELVKTLSVLNKGVKRISKAYACEHILHCSPATKVIKLLLQCLLQLTLENYMIRNLNL